MSRVTLRQTQDELRQSQRLRNDYRLIGRSGGRGRGRCCGCGRGRGRRSHGWWSWSSQVGTVGMIAVRTRSGGSVTGGGGVAEEVDCAEAAEAAAAAATR